LLYSISKRRDRGKVLTAFTVFHDNSLETPNASAGSVGVRYQEGDQNQMQDAGQFVGYGMDGSGFGNANARIEDLGQFWLWDIGP
jgi:hypothetical protein